MRKAASAALIAAILSACATTAPVKPVAVAAQPQATAPTAAARSADAYGAIGFWKEPDVTASAPAGWDPGASDDLPATTVAVFVHASRRARIFVATVSSEGERPADRVHAFIPPDFQGDVTSSIISVGPDDEWASIAWTAHETPRRAKSAQGRIFLRGVAGRPDLQVLVSGVWPQELSSQMAAPFEAVVKSVTVR